MQIQKLILALVVSSVACDSLQGRRSRSGRVGFGGRRGRQEEAAASEYLPPLDDYEEETTLAPIAEEDIVYEDYEVYDDYVEAAPVYAAGTDNVLDAVEDPLAALSANIPGVPGEDYPILAEVPESAFSCEGQVDGGYYADPEAECQVFHICTADGQGGLAKYSFLCPNGTIFNQNYFICDWWFNFDCADAEGLYGLNDEIAAEGSGSEESALDVYGVVTELPVTEVPLGGYDYPAYEDEVVERKRGGRSRAGRKGRKGKKGGQRRKSASRNGRRSGGY